jgi:hypothetical protein
MTPAILAALLSIGTAQQTPPPQDVPVQVEDVVVESRRLERLAREFIDDVAAPTSTRGLARWNAELCVSALNLRTDVAQTIVDRISDVARDLGVRAGEPGCEANVVIVAAGDGAGMATAMVGSRRRAFDTGSPKIHPGDRGLQAFMTSDRPVRWWQMSVPIDSASGKRAIRLPGDAGPPRIVVFAASRLSSQIRDDLNKVFIIVDMDDIQGLTTTQLADYLTMVTLAQIDADGDTSSYDTVLNVFKDREGVTGLTDWDRSYLTGLYAAEQNRINPNAQARNVADAAVSARRARTAANPDPD